MSKTSRRVFLLGTGIYVLCLDLIRPKVADASYQVYSSGQVVDCLERDNGQFRSYSENHEDGAIGFCNNTDRDRQCQSELGESHFYDRDAGACREYDGDIDDCFLTTACTEYAGLDDDCFELETLRAFRDGPLMELPGGNAAVETYYESAPVILARIKAAGNPGIELARLYARYILPSALLVRLGYNCLAFGVYSAMMRDLSVRYDQPLRRSGRAGRH